jgi:L-alanine-DL-glutamate epimerase-like enolase superfamily enzyme
MRITRIDLWHVAIALPAPFHPAWIPGMRQRDNRFDLVRLTTASGIEGWSAAPAMGAERAGLGALLGPYFLGERADDIASVRQRIREMSYLGQRCGWIEAACWDIVGKDRGLPVYALLGGRAGRVKLYASTGELKGGPERAEEVQARVAEGFGTVKLRVHDAELARDLAQLRETRKRVGDAVGLGVDANQAWRVAVIADAPRWDYDRALAFCREAAELGFAWVEEPLAMDDYAGLARLTAATTVPIAGGELNNQGLPEFETMLARRCYDYYQPDAVFTGGIAETWSIIERVAAAGALYSPHTWTNGIGFAINLHLFAASPDRDAKLLEYPLAPPGWVPAARDGLLTRPWQHDRGYLELPAAPGLGFEIDRAALRRHGRHYFTATKLRVALGALRDRGLRDAKHLGDIRSARLAARSAELSAAIAAGVDPLCTAVPARGEQ